MSSTRELLRLAAHPPESTMSARTFFAEAQAQVAARTGSGSDQGGSGWSWDVSASKLGDMDTTQTTYQTGGPEIGSAPTNHTSRRPFRRSRDHKLLGGVCGALAERFGFDVALVRVVAVVLAIVTNGIGALAYLAAWLIVPEEGDDSAPMAAALRR